MRVSAVSFVWICVGCSAGNTGAQTSSTGDNLFLEEEDVRILKRFAVVPQGAPMTEALASDPVSGTLGSDGVGDGRMVWPEWPIPLTID